MEKTCACKGIRTCLRCEGHGAKPETGGLTNKAGTRLVYCQCCQKAWPPGGTSGHPGHNGDSRDFPGILLVHDFITEEEEKTLTKEIDKTPWTESQSGRRKQDYGPKVNFKKKKVKPALFTGLPEFSRKLVESMKQLPELASFAPVEQCHLEYMPERGSAIDPHFDDFWLWGERLVTINMLSDTQLNMTLDSEPDLVVSVPMPRLSLLVVSGPARYEWKHGIDREDISERRLAITYRELTPEFLEGGPLADIGKKLLDTALSFSGHAVGVS